MTPAELDRALRPLIDAALAFDVLRAQAEVAADAMNRFQTALVNDAVASVHGAAPRQSANVARALALVDAGTHTALQAARAAGVAPSTVYRVLAQRRATAERQASTGS